MFWRLAILRYKAWAWWRVYITLLPRTISMIHFSYRYRGKLYGFRERLELWWKNSARSRDRVWDSAKEGDINRLYETALIVDTEGPREKWYLPGGTPMKEWLTEHEMRLLLNYGLLEWGYMGRPDSIKTPSDVILDIDFYHKLSSGEIGGKGRGKKKSGRGGNGIRRGLKIPHL